MRTWISKLEALPRVRRFLVFAGFLYVMFLLIGLVVSLSLGSADRMFHAAVFGLPMAAFSGLALADRRRQHKLLFGEDLPINRTSK